MAAVLTTSSTIQCSHQGTVKTTSAAKLKVNGSSVLVESSLGAIPDCPNQSSSTTKDTKVDSVLGAAQKLKADGNGVLLGTLSGKGNGSPPGTLSASAGQSLLKGV